MDTPIHLKTDDGPAPADEFSYLLTGNGLFLNRTTDFFTSSVPAPRWPDELLAHKPHLTLRYPPLPARVFETIIGFFDIVCRRSGDEAMVLLAWRDGSGYEIVVPEQRVTGGVLYNGRHVPLNIDYQMPNLEPGLRCVGDFHSHGPLGAFESDVDLRDHRRRPGLHLVAGRLADGREPPDLSATMSVDGHCFDIADPWRLVEGYGRRRPEEVPDEWLARVEVRSVPLHEVYPFPAPHDRHLHKQNPRHRHDHR